LPLHHPATTWGCGIIEVENPQAHIIMHYNNLFSLLTGQEFLEPIYFWHLKWIRTGWLTI